MVASSTLHSAAYWVLAHGRSIAKQEVQVPDLYTVEGMLVDSIGSILLTTGGYQRYSVATSDVLGSQFRLMRGWPVDATLNADLAAGITNISVFAQPGARNTTRFLRQMQQQVVTVPTPSMTATLSNNVITFSGGGSTNELIGITCNAGQDGYAYQLQATDTPSSVASLFASVLPNCTASGATLTFDNHAKVGITIGCNVTVAKEVHRSDQTWRITVWAPTTDLRDSFCALIDANLQNIDRLYFTDGSVSGPIINAGTYVEDITEKENLWRRCLLICVEYPVDVMLTVPVMVMGEVQDGSGIFNFHVA